MKKSIRNFLSKPTNPLVLCLGGLLALGLYHLYLWLFSNIEMAFLLGLGIFIFLCVMAGIIVWVVYIRKPRKTTSYKNTARKFFITKTPSNN